MIITKKHLSRRTILRGFGASLALPLLDGMVPAMSALSQTAARGVRRMAVVYTPNGMMMPDWTPKGDGAAFEFSPILAPLEPYRDKLVVVSGLADKYGWPQGDEGAGDHARASATFLTGVHAKKTEGSRYPGRHFDGPDCGGHARAGHAAGVARTRARIGRAPRRVRRRLQLCLRQHHRLAQSDDAAADGERSASGVRAAVRRRRHAPMPPPGWRGSNGSEAFSIRWPTRSRRCAAVSARATTPSWPSTWRRSATSNAGFRKPRSRAAGSCRSSSSRRERQEPSKNTRG